MLKKFIDGKIEENVHSFAYIEENEAFIRDIEILSLIKNGLDSPIAVRSNNDFLSEIIKKVEEAYKKYYYLTNEDYSGIPRGYTISQDISRKYGLTQQDIDNVIQARNNILNYDNKHEKFDNYFPAIITIGLFSALLIFTGAETAAFISIGAAIPTIMIMSTISQRYYLKSNNESQGWHKRCYEITDFDNVPQRFRNMRISQLIRLAKAENNKFELDEETIRLISSIEENLRILKDAEQEKSKIIMMKNKIKKLAS